MIRKLLVAAAALSIPVSVVAVAGGVAGAKTVVPPDPSQNCSISATVDFGTYGLSITGQATTAKTTDTTISGETLNCTDGNGGTGTATITTALDISSKTTTCAAAITAAGGIPAPTTFTNDVSGANAQAATDTSNMGIPTACISVTSKDKKGTTTSTLKAAKENIAGSLAGFAGSASASLQKALKSLDVTVTDPSLADSPIAYATKTSTATFPASGCTGEDVGFAATGTVSAPKVDKGQASALTACLGTVTGLSGQGGGIVDGSTHFIDVLDGSVAGTIGTANINDADSTFTIGS